MQYFDNIFKASQENLTRVVADRQSLIRRELEQALVEECRKALAVRPDPRIDFSSAEAYEVSCADKRKDWGRVLGVFALEADLSPQSEPYFENDRFLARYVSIELGMGVRGRAVLAQPKDQHGARPLVIAQHGVSSAPEPIALR